MKKYFSFFKILSFVITSFFILGCVHDDKYNTPDLSGNQCQDLTATITIAQLKALFTGTAAYVFPSNSTAVLEGYVSSTDETGNIYKTIYIQDSPTNPTQGLTISVNAVNNYTQYPQGSKIYIKLNDLALGTYGGLIQIGVKSLNPTALATDLDRIGQTDVPLHIFRSCTTLAQIVPKVMTLTDLKTENDQYIGCLVQINDAEFDAKALCNNYAPNLNTINRQLNDPTSSTTTHVVRNSGYASFANQKLPSGKGKFIGILSKFSSTYQFFINKVTDLSDMKQYPRKDGIAADPCALDQSNSVNKTIAEIKQLYVNGTASQITDDYLIKAKVTANDETGNLYKYVYIEDATGGIKININKLNLYLDARFRVGATVYVKLKGTYIGDTGGEIQIGAIPSGSMVSRISEADIYKYFFDSNLALTNVIPTEKTITQLSAADVGKWIKIKNLEFINSDLGKTYADASNTSSNRTLEDCSGNKITLRTNGAADFGSYPTSSYPASTTVIDGGKGDVYAVLSVFNGVYQLYITNLLGANLNGARCDGSVYIPATVLFSDPFDASGFGTSWTTISVTGDEVWHTSNVGTGSNYYAVMSGYASGNKANEDWLISKQIDLSGLTKASLFFDKSTNFAGDNLVALVTDNYTGNPSTTTWTTLASLPATNTGYSFSNSGELSLNSFVNKKVQLAFKYTSTTASSATWEIDNVKVQGNK